MHRNLGINYFLSELRLAWQVFRKKTKVELMVKKGIKGIMCHAIHRYAKANNKYMKDKDPSTESSFLVY